MSALLQEDDDDAEPITDGELRRALYRGKASSPDDDGITYIVLHLQQRVPASIFYNCVMVGVFIKGVLFLCIGVNLNLVRLR